MTDEQARRDNLIAAALAGELDVEERREFERVCAADPDLLSEYLAVKDTAERLERSNLRWVEQDLPPGLADRVIAATTGDPEEGVAARYPGAAPFPQANDAGLKQIGASHHRRTYGSRKAVIGLAAAGLLLIGALGGAVIDNVLQSPPDGPPGALGVTENVVFPEVPEGVSFDAAVVAHTWGTETVLEVDGLTVGESFEVVLVSEDGRELTSGTFLGSEQTVTCSLNAALMREDVSELQIRRDSGEVVASSILPEV
ncbi:hypothetical protein GCM10027404_13240 [Arthrobacter tumbae]|uniref:hypothetical protein n=1 Tax=Arthrobacter tumbae TaxID=163874 RepID=UPI00195A9FBD|nr:hypothetical protein [Arthrobacter tumbae]MBM7782606.1 anti-sigma factor RsiW [Arthrobacter tumbae]